MKRAIFKTKIAEDIKRNGQEVKVLDYVGNDMYKIEFKDGKQLTVYDTELIFIGGESLYD
jgi:hypothetical protein